MQLCRVCGAEFHRRGRPGVCCSRPCRYEWQRRQKPVDRDWLYQKYVVEGLSTYAIGKIVRRDPKRVYAWLCDFGIPTRKRSWSTNPSDDEKKPYHDAEWLRREYVDRQRSAGDIAADFSVTEATVTFYLKRFDIKRRTISEARSVKHWGLEGEANGMFGRRGADVPSWKGGVTPERQAFYSSPEWRRAARKARERDHGICRRCGVNHRGRCHLHHVIPFAVEEKRADIDNLVSLCPECHRFVHSKANVDREFLGKEV